jgi:hypothetical protein
VASTLIPEQVTVNEVRDAFLGAMSEIEELEEALDYIPESITSTAMVTLFVDEEEVKAPMGGRPPAVVRWVWIVDLYAYGYENREMQHRFESIILQMRRKLRQKHLFGGILRKRFELARQGDPALTTINNQKVVRQRFRLTNERQVSSAS